MALRRKPLHSHGSAENHLSHLRRGTAVRELFLGILFLQLNGVTTAISRVKKPSYKALFTGPHFIPFITADGAPRLYRKMIPEKVLSGSPALTE